MRSFFRLTRETFRVLLDVVFFLGLCFRPIAAVSAENLFLRRQLGLFVERNVRRRPATDSVRFILARLSRLLDWRSVLVVVKPDTLIRWHRRGFRLFWKWKSRPRGRPRVPQNLQQLIVEMATSNPTWAKNVLPTNCS